MYTTLIMYYLCNLLVHPTNIRPRKTSLRPLKVCIPCALILSLTHMRMHPRPVFLFTLPAPIAPLDTPASTCILLHPPLPRTSTVPGDATDLNKRA